MIKPIEISEEFLIDTVEDLEELIDQVRNRTDHLDKVPVRLLNSSPKTEELKGVIFDLTREEIENPDLESESAYTAKLWIKHYY